MNARLLSVSAALLLAGFASAQPSPAPAITVDPGLAGALPAAALTDEQLEQLVAPIALYPDALIALILPASVASTDIVLAARHVRDFPNDRSQIEHRAWDESVKSLTHYPEVVRWMDENLTWTKQLGEAFTQQPADVMQAIQRLRARTHAAGTLTSTPQQQVLAEPDVIRIVPAQPDVIYVPRYEPDIVFVHEPVYYTAPVISFGLGYRVGSWLAYDCDWRRRTIWVGDRHRAWRGHDWHRPLVPIAPPHSHHVSVGFRQWRPPAPSRYHRPAAPTLHTRIDIMRPAPVGSPHAPRTWTSRSQAYAGPSHTTRTHYQSPNTPPASVPAETLSTSRSSSRPAPSSANRRLTMPQTPLASAQIYNSPAPAPAAAPAPTPATTVRSAPSSPREHSRAHPPAHASTRVMGPMPTPAQAAAAPPSQRQHLSTRSAPAAVAASAPAPATAQAAPAPAFEAAPNTTRPAPNNTTSHRGRVYQNPRRENDAER